MWDPGNMINVGDVTVILQMLAVLASGTRMKNEGTTKIRGVNMD